MIGTRRDASDEARTPAIDSLARSCHARMSRREVAGMLAATIATGLLGLARQSEPVIARKKRGKRSAMESAGAAEIRRGIPSNCIYVCCDGTCDTWKMCLKCVKWPQPTTTGTLAS